MTNTCSPQGLVEREAFFARVDRRGANECWPWLGSTMKKSARGVFYFKGKNYIAARVAWHLHAGEPPPANLFVCHSCDNPNCVNPSHLWLGTNSDNIKDAASKGRLYMQRFPEKAPKGIRKAKGTAHGRAKLDDSLVLQMRAQYAAGASLKGLADQYGVAPRTIADAVKRVTWTHV
jgi:hypothetical protein